MRRFSQRHSMVTLSDINITPLLDLAFVLLIIFVIISPGIKSATENSLDLNLPKGGSSNKPLDPKNIRTVEADPAGGYRLDKQPMTIEQLKAALRSAAQGNPNLIVDLRAGVDDRWGRVAAILAFCQMEEIQVRPMTQP